VIAQEGAASCLGFAIDCGVLLKGAGVTIAGFVLFVGSVYLLLSAIFGRWMGYLVLMTCFAGWMIIQSALWAWGFWSLGPETSVNLGPRGTEPAWVVSNAGITAAGEDFEEFASYPAAPWEEPNLEDEAAASEVTAAQGAATVYLAEQANEELGRDPFGVDGITAAQFTVDDTRFATAADGTDLAVIVAHFTAGGPATTLSMHFDNGSVAFYSYLFLAVSVLLFVVHVPLLDRAERKRREFLTGGSQPAWYGPA
jgi:hypothetical protein